MKPKHCKVEKLSRKQKQERRKPAQFNATCTHLCWCPGRVPNKINHFVTRRRELHPTSVPSVPSFCPTNDPIHVKSSMFIVACFSNQQNENTYLPCSYILQKTMKQNINIWKKIWHCTWCTKITTPVIRSGPQIKILSSRFNTVSDHPEYLILKLRCY